MESKFNYVCQRPIIVDDITKWELISEIKNNFIDNEVMPSPAAYLPQEVIDSWVYSKQCGIDRYKWPMPKVSDSQLELIMEENSQLIYAAKPFITGYAPYLSDYNMILYDYNGIILDYARIRENELIEKGRIRSENVVGTTAHNLAARHKRPVQIIGTINYCKELEKNVTSSAPILNEYGELLGTIVLYQKEAHGMWNLGHDLGWISSTASAISNQLRLFRRDTRLKAMDETFKKALEHSKHAYISIDNHGHIINYNNEAGMILGISTKPKTLFFDMLTDCTSLKKALKEEPSNIILNITGKNYNAHITPFTNGAMIKISQDIKKKKSRIFFDDILYTSKTMQSIVDTAKLVSRNPINILLLGESGTGKELFAQAIHNSYSDGPFVAINCASIPASLIASELFGYEKGAFTGADNEGKKGKIEQANGGTLFLDEIGDMPLDLQPVLLRVLEEKQITRLGGTKSTHVDFRVISATNRQLYIDVKNKLFRGDLYYRLSVVNIDIPPLRERLGDVEYLANKFIEKTCKRFELAKYGLSREATDILNSYNWPGNIRQLENAMIYAVSFAKNNIITINDLPREIVSGEISADVKNLDKVSQLEHSILLEAVNNTKNMESAAKQLGISRSTLYRKLKKLKK